MEIIIRQANLDDLETIQNLNKKLAKHMQEFEPWVEDNWSFSKKGSGYFKHRISKLGQGCLYLATLDDVFVGYLAGGLIDKPERKIKTAELENMFVIDKFRKMKVGTKLVDEFLKWCRGHKVKLVKVSTAAGNAKTLKFYRKLGFCDQTVKLERRL
jgi:GNAT superfamily N-acetyltransferase